MEESERSRSGGGGEKKLRSPWCWCFLLEVRWRMSSVTGGAGRCLSGSLAGVFCQAPVAEGRWEEELGSTLACKVCKIPCGWMPGPLLSGTSTVIGDGGALPCIMK